MAVVVEVADQRHVAPGCLQPLADVRHRGGGLGRVHGDAHDLGARVGQRLDLFRRGAGVLGVRVGHGLDDDRRAAADRDAADPHTDAFASPLTGAVRRHLRSSSRPGTPSAAVYHSPPEPATGPVSPRVDPNDTFTEPIGQFFVSHFALGNSENCFDDFRVRFDELVTAALHQ